MAYNATFFENPISNVWYSFQNTLTGLHLGCDCKELALRSFFPCVYPYLRQETVIGANNGTVYLQNNSAIQNVLWQFAGGMIFWIHGAAIPYSPPKLRLWLQWPVILLQPGNLLVCGLYTHTHPSLGVCDNSSVRWYVSEASPMDLSDTKPDSHVFNIIAPADPALSELAPDPVTGNLSVASYNPKAMGWKFSSVSEINDQHWSAVCKVTCVLI
jgi:hypothetical protein